MFKTYHLGDSLDMGAYKHDSQISALDEWMNTIYLEWKFRYTFGKEELYFRRVLFEIVGDSQEEEFCKLDVGS